MQLISTRIHGVLDYLVGFFLIGVPWLLNFARNGAETWIPVTLGVAAIVYSLCTNYELGVSKALTMRFHLVLDFFAGILLALSPWLFGFNEYIYLPHLMLGLLSIAVPLLTDPVVSSEENRDNSIERTHRPAH